MTQVLRYPESFHAKSCVPLFGTYIQDLVQVNLHEDL